MRKIFIILLMLSLLVTPVLGIFNWEESYKYQGDYADVKNQRVDNTDFESLNRLLLISHDMGLKHPVILDLIGIQTLQRSRQLVTYRNIFSGAYIDVYSKIDGDYVQITSKSIPNIEIIDMIGITAVEDVYEREHLIIIYRENGKVKFSKYRLDGTSLTNSNLVLVSTDSRQLDDYTQISVIHCAEHKSGGVPYYMCAYAIEQNDEHKVVTFGSSSSYNKLITFEDDVLLHQPTRLIGMDVLPSTVVVADINNRLLVVDYHQPLGTLTSNTGNTGDRGLNQTVTLYNIDSCSTNCELTTNDKINVYTSDTLKYTGNSQKLITALRPVPSDPFGETTHNNKYLHHKFGIAFLERESAQSYSAWPTTSSRMVENFVLIRHTGFVQNNYEIQDIVTKTSSYDTATRTNLYMQTKPIAELEFFITELSQSSGYTWDLCTTTNGIGQAGTTDVSKIVCITPDLDEYFSFVTHNIEGLLTQKRIQIVGTIKNNNEPLLILRDMSANTYFTINESGTRGTLPEFVAPLEGYFYPITLQQTPTSGNIASEGNQDIMHYLEGSIYIYYKYSVEVDTIIIDRQQPYDGISGFYNPALVNTSQIFRAIKCGEDMKNCAFVNTNPNPNIQYKLCSTCGGTIEYTCGLSRTYNPATFCYFNTTGTYNLVFDLYTNTKPDEVAQTFYVNNLVVATEGNTNLILPPSNPQFDVPILPTIVIPDSRSFWEIIQSNIKTIIGLFIVLTLVSTLAAQGIRNPIVLLFAAIIGLVLTNILGLVSITVTIMLLVGIVILILLSQTVFKGRDGGM